MSGRRGPPAAEDAAAGAPVGGTVAARRAPSPIELGDRRVAVLGADVGNSKTEVLLVGPDGRLLGFARGPTASPQRIGMAHVAGALEITVAAAARDAGGSVDSLLPARASVYCMAGADFRDDERLLTAAIAPRPWSAGTAIYNDTFAALRAGTTRPWGVAVICGAGMNCVGVAPTGRSWRFPALGPISGDLGGGWWLGSEALSAAVRARDGRGPRTSLERIVPARFGLKRPSAVTLALYRGRLTRGDLRTLAPDVLAASAAGDRVARTIVDRQALEVASMALAVIRRLHLVRTDVEVVLAGGVLASGDPYLVGLVERLVCSAVPKARIVVLRDPPVLGAALLGLDAIDAGEDARDRLRHDLRARLAQGHPAQADPEPGEPGEA